MIEPHQPAVGLERHADGVKSELDGARAIRALTQPLGGHAPDLTHLSSRRMIAAGLLSNTPDHLIDWVAHAQELKPGTRMPDIALSPQEAAALSAYLATLR